jgi:cytoskeletal protein RodZ
MPLTDSATNENLAIENNKPLLLTVTQAPLTANTNNAASAQATLADKLEVSFTQKSWVQIKNIEGITLHDAEHQAGEHITVGGKSPFYVWLKNGKAVTILFNGEPVKIDNIDNKGVARLVVGK